MRHLPDANFYRRGQLDVQRLRALLRKFDRFPDAHRLHLWRYLLGLPCNASAHQCLLAKGPHPTLEGLAARLPLIERRNLHRLERLLSCLAYWCILHHARAGYTSRVLRRI